MSHVHKDLYQVVTDQIIAALEAGTPPWVCPWARSPGDALPANLATGRQYRGINTILLNMRKRSFIYALSPQRELRDACVHVEQRGHMRCRGTQRY